MKTFFCKTGFHTDTAIFATNWKYMQISEQVSAFIPSQWGRIRVIAYAEDERDEMPHLLFIHPECNTSNTVTVRLHSECFTGDLLGSKRCDCGEQLDKAMAYVMEEKGLLLYLRQEGRGIGLINKLKAYNLQDKGLNTIDANHQLGFETDERSYAIASQILKGLGLSKIKLLTNNPEKIASLRSEGIEIVERIPLLTIPQENNRSYLKVKKDLMGHLFD